MDPSQWPGCVVAVWQHEVGEGGTEHLQGYVNFSKSTRGGAVKKLAGMERAHLEPRKGTKADNLRYCTKEEGRLDGPYYFPSKEKVEAYCRIENGARTDLNALSDLVARGLSDREIAEDNPVHIIKFQKGIDSLRLATAVPGRLGEELDSVLYLGPSGTGKSHRLRRECPPGPDWFWVSPGKWFDGYEGQAGLVFDEFRDTWCPYSYLLKLVDVYPFRVEKKGSHVCMRAFRFRFSSNVHPSAWWRNRQGKCSWATDPLRRRLRVVELMLKPYAGLEEPVDNALIWWEQQPEAIAPEARALFGQRMED